MIILEAARIHAVLCQKREVHAIGFRKVCSKSLSDCACMRFLPLSIVTNLQGVLLPVWGGKYCSKL